MPRFGGLIIVLCSVFVRYNSLPMEATKHGNLVGDFRNVADFVLIC